MSRWGPKPCQPQSISTWPSGEGDGELGRDGGQIGTGLFADLDAEGNANDGIVTGAGFDIADEGAEQRLDAGSHGRAGGRKRTAIADEVFPSGELQSGVLDDDLGVDALGEVVGMVRLFM